MRTPGLFLALTIVAELIVAGSLGAEGSSGQDAQAGQKAPASLVNVGEFGENVFDLVKAKDWPKVSDKFKDLEAAVKQLAGDLKEAEKGIKRLDPIMAALGKAIAAKDQHLAMREANQVTLIAADLIEPFNPQVPAAVTRLDYFGRELEIWVADKDLGKLKSAGEAMIKVWEKLHPTVKTRGGEAEAKKFEALMIQVAAAKTIEDYGRLATPILDEVDNLEKVFKKR
jgi:hypothetical protein